jgi:hypothetical protein
MQPTAAALSASSAGERPTLGHLIMDGTFKGDRKRSACANRSAGSVDETAIRELIQHEVVRVELIRIEHADEGRRDSLRVLEEFLGRSRA